MMAIPHVVVVGCLLLLVSGAAAGLDTTPVKPVLWQQTHQSMIKSVAAGVLPATSSRGALPVMLIGSQGIGDEEVEVIHPRNGSLLWSSTALKQWTYTVALQPVVMSATGGGELQRGVAGFGCSFSGHAKGTPPPPPLKLGFWPDAGGSASAPSWQVVIPNSTQNSGVGPPKVHFSGDGRSLLILYHGEQSFDGQDLEYLGVLSVDNPTTVPMVTTLLGTGYGHKLLVLRPAAADPPVAAKPAPTLALVTRANMTYIGGNEVGEVEEHFTMHYSSAPGSPVVVSATPIIDCNRTGDCHILASSPDLSQIVVSVGGGSVSAHFPDIALCKYELTNPWRWGVALLTADGAGTGGSWPYAGYSLSWVKCSADDKSPGTRKLASVHIVNTGSVVMTFTHMNGVGSGSGADGIEACAFSSAAGGDEIWCTANVPITPPMSLYEATDTLLPNAMGSAGHIAVAIAQFGILAVDGAAKAQPAFQMVYEPASNDDCCMPTALEIVTEQAKQQEAGVGLEAEAASVVAMLVASIPNGKMDGVWCRCFGSKLVGVALTPSTPDRT